MRKTRFYLALIALLVVVDQVSKWMVLRRVSLYSTVAIIPGFFNITHIHNRGAIFGAFSQVGNPHVYVALTLASLLALGMVIYYFIITPAAERGVKTSLTLILAGALGNLIDRVFRGYVIDFLDFYVGKWHWPFFNAADSCITIGAILLLFFFVKRKPACSPSSSA
ncbi:MAG: signal peptidase II [Clostridiales bacterium]|nr:signal peptidase II [Clostridiales bacterium]